MLSIPILSLSQALKCEDCVTVLGIERGRPKLRMTRESQPLQGESVDRRLDELATAMAGFNRN